MAPRFYQTSGADRFLHDEDRRYVAAKVIHLNRAAPVFQALRERAQADNVPTARFRRALQLALRLLDEGRSSATAVSEGVKAMRPVHAVRVPGGVE